MNMDEREKNPEELQARPPHAAPPAEGEQPQGEAPPPEKKPRKRFRLREDIEAITMVFVDLHWLSNDLTRAVVESGCRDQEAIDLSECLDCVDELGTDLRTAGATE